MGKNIYICMYVYVYTYVYIYVYVYERIYTYVYVYVCVHIHMYTYMCMWVYICIYYFLFFHYGLLQDIEYSSLCYTVRPCCLIHSINNSLHPILVCIIYIIVDPKLPI